MRVPGRSSHESRLVIFWDAEHFVVFFLTDDASALGQVEALRLLPNHAFGLLARPYHQITVEHVELEGPHETQGKERRQHLWIVRLDCAKR